MKLVVSDNEEGILYVVQKEWSLRLFAEFYRLNLEDLMTLNYISDDSEILYPGQELFINVSEQRAYDIGLLEKASRCFQKMSCQKNLLLRKNLQEEYILLVLELLFLNELLLDEIVEENQELFQGGIIIRKFQMDLLLVSVRGMQL